MFPVTVLYILLTVTLTDKITFTGRCINTNQTAVGLGSCWLHRLSLSLSLPGTAILGEFCYQMSWNTLTKTKLIPVSPAFAIIADVMAAMLEYS